MKLSEKIDTLTDSEMKMVFGKSGNSCNIEGMACTGNCIGVSPSGRQFEGYCLPIHTY